MAILIAVLLAALDVRKPKWERWIRHIRGALVVFAAITVIQIMLTMQAKTGEPVTETNIKGKVQEWSIGYGYQLTQKDAQQDAAETAHFSYEVTDVATNARKVPIKVTRLKNRPRYLTFIAPVTLDEPHAKTFKELSNVNIYPLMVTVSIEMARQGVEARLADGFVLETHLPITGNMVETDYISKLHELKIASDLASNHVLAYLLAVQRQREAPELRKER